MTQIVHKIRRLFSITVWETVDVTTTSPEYIETGIGDDVLKLLEKTRKEHNDAGQEIRAMNKLEKRIS